MDQPTLKRITVREMNTEKFLQMEGFELSASSTLKALHSEISAENVLDGDPATAWQEGADDDGINEYLKFFWGEEKSIKYLTFQMGNWRSEEAFRQNNVPKKIRIKFDNGYVYNVELPHEMEDIVLEFSEEIKTTGLKVIIKAVYSGTVYRDTCISEAAIWG